MAGEPLAGKRVLVTRTREQSSSLAAGLRALGAEVLEVPTIRIEPPSSYDPLDQALARLTDYDVLLVTSANTARVLAARTPAGTPARSDAEGQPYTVAVGPATAEALRLAGFRVDLVPAPAIAESVLAALAPTGRGKRMLLLRAAVARDVLPDGLRAAGAVVDVVEAYRTVLAEDSRVVLQQALSTAAAPIDAVTFSSSSTVENFFALLGDREANAALRRCRACSIGPITSNALLNRGVVAAVEADPHDVSGLIEAVRLALTV